MQAAESFLYVALPFVLLELLCPSTFQHEVVLPFIFFFLKYMQRRPQLPPLLKSVSDRCLAPYI